MPEYLSPDEIDFAAYMHETDAQQKVRPSSEYIDDLLEGLGRPQPEERKSYLPWDKTHALFAFRPGEVTLWGGVNGHGKSLVTGLAAVSLCVQGEKTCIASFEMKPRKTLHRMARQFMGAVIPTEDDPESMMAQRDAYEQLRAGMSSLWLYDQQGTVKTHQAIAVMRYCAKELGIQHFFLDNLGKCVANEDDYNAQKLLIDESTAIARDHGMHIHIVHHIKKLATEEAMPDKMDVKGTGAITDQVDNLLLVWRNKKKERESQAGKMVSATEPDAMLICDKQRNGEWEGRFQLWFHKASQQFVGSSGAQPLNFFSGFPHRGEQ